jgi:hypothetical protein
MTDDSAPTTPAVLEFFARLSAAVDAVDAHPNLRLLAAEVVDSTAPQYWREILINEAARIGSAMLRSRDREARWRRAQMGLVDPGEPDTGA